VFFCTFINKITANKCEMCEKKFDAFFEYVSPVDGDTTYADPTTVLCIRNELFTINKTIDFQMKSDFSPG
jgi:hypothetical protein